MLPQDFSIAGALAFQLGRVSEAVDCGGLVGAYIVSKSSHSLIAGHPLISVPSPW